MLRLFLVFSLCLCAFGQDDLSIAKPMVPRLDPLDTANPLLYQGIVTPKEDPSLKPKQRRAISAVAPIWYSDPDTKNLERISIDAQVKSDTEKGEVALGVDENTIQWMVNEAGESVYAIGGHKLRIWIAEQKTEEVAVEVPVADIAASRPDALVKEEAGKVSMEGVLPDVKIEHVIEPGRIKEYLRIQKAPDLKDVKTVRYAWQYDSDLVPVSENGDVLWQVNGVTVLLFPAPVAWDAKEAPLSASYELDGKTRTVTIVLDAAELADAAYPVTVDPTVADNTNKPTANACILYDGPNPYPKDYKKAFWKFTMPRLWGMSQIDAASLKGRYEGRGADGGTLTVNAYLETGKSWTESSTYSTLDGLSFSSNPMSVGLSGNAYSAFEISLLAIVASLYSTTENPGEATLMMEDTGWGARGNSLNTKVTSPIIVGNYSLSGYTKDSFRFDVRTGTTGNVPYFSITYTEYDSYVSDATEDSGFHVGENLSVGEDGYNDDGYVAYERTFALFRNLPDLTGKEIECVRYDVYCDAVAGGALSDINSYVAALGDAWDEASSAATMAALSLGTVIDSNMTTAVSTWSYVDLTSAFDTIYTADPTPANTTVALDCELGASLTSTHASVQLGDEAAIDGWRGFHTRAEANYPRLTIWYSTPPSAQQSGTGSVGMILGKLFRWPDLGNRRN